MACFLVPTAEAVITTIAAKAVKHHEAENSENSKINFSEKLGWLNKMLWGGSALLTFEHIWHGEVTPFFPFLTAACDPESTAVMLQEMGTSGVAMALLVTAVWAGMVAVSSAIEKRKTTAIETAEGAAKS